jgi:thiosulfate reductase cytochrome b subunit
VRLPRVRIPLRERIARLPRVGKFFLGSGLVIVAAAIVVMAARLIVTIPSVAMFVVDYPGATDLPSNAPRGIPAWLGWQHFFNVFLMVLVIRSGLRIRREQRPRAYWAPRRNPAAKVSLTVWFHQSLDILWLINGVAFVVLLFVTGQWMRIVPTSWQIFPNAASAAVQYATLDWPLENGWVNYNSLQVLTYFTTVFIAAPLAAVTGFRMSGMWPASARRLNSLFKMEWARALHFPVMIYFCAFIAVHIFLVLTTGALRNLNHMYASRDVVDWLGFWIFVASLGVIAGAWIAVRPLVIAPIARLFGPVTSR